MISLLVVTSTVVVNAVQELEVRAGSGECAVEGLASVLWKVWQVCCGRSGECAVEGLVSVLWKVW